MAAGEAESQYLHVLSAFLAMEPVDSVISLARYNTTVTYRRLRRELLCLICSGVSFLLSVCTFYVESVPEDHLRRVSKGFSGKLALKL